MKNTNRVVSAVRVLLMLLLLTCIALPALGDCGKERWPVKTLQDTGAGKIDFGLDTGKAVADLRKIPAPANLKTVGNDFRFPAETKTYSVHALLIGFKKEADEDYHVVIADTQNPKLTMIVEIPSPDCADRSYAKEFTVDRRFIESIHKISSKFYRLKKPIPITVTGVFFFDFLHGQTGVAPNGAELHPLLTIENQ